MNITEDSKVLAKDLPDSTPAHTGGERRADIEAKHAAVTKMVQDAGCEGLLAVMPENFSWLTCGAMSGGTQSDAAHPCLFYFGDNRFVLCSNADTQRIFDEEIDGLGFQVKEWPWQQGRNQLLIDLCQPRNLAADRPLGNCKVLSDPLRRLRCRLTPYERACYESLGAIVSHALEATGRTLAKGEPEREVAGQISHRLLHRGAVALQVGIAADGRRRAYRQPTFTGSPIRDNCTLFVVARKYGLCAQASRSISFGQPDAEFRREHDATCKISAAYIAGSWPDAVPRQILLSGRRIFQMLGYEHEWLLCPQGHITGWVPVEKMLAPQTEELLEANLAVSWQVGVGAAISSDTFLLSEDGPKLVTPIENWPVKRIRIQGAEFFRPDILVR